MSDDQAPVALPRILMAPLSPLLGDPDWINGFKWMVDQLFDCADSVTQHRAMPNYQAMLITTKWKPFLEGLAAHVYKVVEDGRNRSPIRVLVGNGDVNDAYQLACSAFEEKVADLAGPDDAMLSALKGIREKLSRWQPPLPAATAETNQAPAAAPASGSKIKPPGDPATRAVTAAYALRKAGKPVSVRAACKTARVDRKNLTAKYPETIAIIEKLAEPDRKPPSGEYDRRTGNLDARDNPEDDDLEDD